MKCLSAGALAVLVLGAPPATAAYDEHHDEYVGSWALEADVSWLPVAGVDDPPKDLTQPVSVEDLLPRTDVQPFGVVRSSMDHEQVGHGGIDLRMVKDAPLRAVADGLILAITPVEGQPHESEVIVLLTTGPRPGTGWGLVYAHVHPAPGIAAGQRVRRGALVATSIYGTGYSVHLELSYRFEGYRYMRQQTCWVDQLRPRDQRTLLVWFEQLRSRKEFTQAWEMTDFSGRYPFRALLNTREFPDGPQMCYPRGTDVR